MAKSESRRVAVVDVPPELAGLELLDWAVERFEPSHVIGCFSGGHDSLTATHLASQHPAFSFAAHLNTGIGIEATRVFVRETCAALGIELREYRARDYLAVDGSPAPQRYEDFVLAHGFPGPPQHYRMYQRLKERPLRHMIRDLDRGRHDKVLLVTGVRQEESVRRMNHVDQVQIWEGTKVWVAPLWNLTKAEVNRYVAENDLPRNAVVDKIHMSGECLCGAFARPDELDELRFWFPEVVEEIEELTRRAYAAGFLWRWDERPPKKGRSDEVPLPGMEMLCVGCRGHDDEVE